jgi:hypothetical protein
MDTYLIKYLRDNADSALSKKYIDFFKVELDFHIYISETYMSKPYHRKTGLDFNTKMIRMYQFLNALFFSSNDKASKNLKVLSTVYLPINEEFSRLKIDSYAPVWHPIGKKNIFGDFKTIRWYQEMQSRFRNGDFHEFLDSKLHTDLEEFQNRLIQQYQQKDFRALFLYTDQYFYSKYSIDIFKKLDRPSFIFSHGMPGIYSKEVDNRSDYLLLWSEKIKENYINAGFKSSKLKVVGNPKYKNLEKHKSLRSDVSDILVVPLTSATWVQHEYDETVFTDPGMTALYLYKVQNVLENLGIKKARYRTHPTMNKDWVHAFLDQNFYVKDTETLEASLNRSSLVIGVNSTLLLEALIHGVNYLLFDPKQQGGVNLLGYKSVPPFDGSEDKLMIAEDEVELEKMIKTNAQTDYSLVHDYIQDFDLSVLKDLIN